VKERLDNNSCKHLFILALGNQAYLNIKSCFVILEKLCIPCENSFLSALGVCYKAFVVLGLEFLMESRPHWQYIDHVIFGRVASLELLSPALKFLIGQTAWRAH